MLDVIDATQTYRMARIEETDTFIDGIKAKVGKYWGFYLYKPGEYVHCCEIPPSHWLECFDFETENKIDDDLHSELGVYLYDSSHYRHVASVAKLETCSVGDFESPEEALEYVQGNYSWMGNGK
ncbi:hypothetical protein [Ferribacterium limneticum]|uniref:hypothetical protein n=1 Tax=Ferribacterium limneticum TaxID=76259 RepID=UPI001CF8EE18|nr:hypothetical protein [Ferribacterium limneticum]UCV26758.1 hypothetical protein KI617_10595 [Ferribacterium limneticum]UCV30675.1 hypothetical protein KI608_10595 [Ferribacterium limneticum]